ncbi:GDP-fucose protein O-fucosyltransferase [Dillenia turbinata]|uniref:O-fucosyltransferase family protein n=1 Tax=Dillenia turbinata TaxID=194707 RepID=A0AAN8Z6B0_9MAGN
MKGEGKMVLKSRMKWVALFGLVLSAISLFTHFLIARHTEEAISEYKSSITLFSWRPIFDNVDFQRYSPVYRRLWGPVRKLENLLPHANPRGDYAEFKSFAYLYNEEQFMVALEKDVKVVKTLPKNLKGARRKKEIPVFRVLPVLNRHSVVELVVSDGGCLQAILPRHLEEYQRLRCRVAFHALQFRQEVQELATKILYRLQSSGRPFIAYEPGLTREALAYHGCAELFQDVHTELIQHKRSWMIKRGIVKEKLSVNSAEQRRNGLCPIMPEEVGILLRAYGYSSDTIIYLSGGEVFGGQRILIPLHAMFENVVDRTSLSSNWELSKMYGREVNLVDRYPRSPPSSKKANKREDWKTSGPRPLPLPPPPARPKYPYNIEGWWGWVAESDNEPARTVAELRITAHKLLWEAIDYSVCVEADVFITGFDRDGYGRPNFASLVMGHRLYQSASAITYRPDRKEVFRILNETRDHMYQANRTWLTSVRRHLRRSIVDGLLEASARSKSQSFLSHPVPECSCMNPTVSYSHASSPSSHSQIQAALGVVQHCPAWMNNDVMTKFRDKENEEDNDEDDSSSAGLFFRHNGISHEGGGGEMIKDEAQMDDQEELEGVER